MTPTLRLALLAALPLLVLVAPARAQPAAPHDATVLDERWSVVRLQDQPAGHTFERTTRDGDHITRRSKMNLRIQRGGQAMTVGIDSEFVETPDHTPIEARTTKKMGIMSMSTHVRFAGDKLVKTIRQAGQSRTETVPAPEGDWLTPMQVERFIRERVEAGDADFAYTMFNHTDAFALETVNATVVGGENIDVFGRTVRATHLKVTLSAKPGMVGDVWVDDTGNEIKSAFDLGGLRLELVAADKQLALAHKSPPELLNNMLIELDRPIDNPRALHKATYRLSVKQGELPDLPGSPIQNARRIDRQTARVTVDLAHADPGPVPKMAAPPVRHSAMADGRDAKIIDLAEQATENAGDKRAARAEAMRRFVHDHVDDKNLGVGMATAGEVARTQQGDCTEHAVLLAALLRADGIPSRMASGVVYVHDGSGRRDVFGYHAWTQAWIDDNAGPRWVNLDAALTAAHPYDATHIILSTTDLEDGQWTNDIVEMAGLFGRLRIERVNAQP